MKKENKLEARSMIFIIIWSFSYWPRQNIRGIEGSISKKFLRKKQYCHQESGQTVSGAKSIPLFILTKLVHTCMYVCTCTYSWIQRPTDFFCRMAAALAISASTRSWGQYEPSQSIPRTICGHSQSNFDTLNLNEIVNCSGLLLKQCSGCKM